MHLLKIIIWMLLSMLCLIAQGMDGVKTDTTVVQWKALWMEAPKQTSSMLFRKEFFLKKRVVKARVFTTSQGLYELRLNGKCVGDELFTPGWTSYNNRLQYQEYDVTSLLRYGENVIGIMVGNGWYRSRMAKVRGRWTYGDKLRALLQLEVTYKDGTSDTIVSNSSWKTTQGPITATDIYDGETYDARLEKIGWDIPGYDDSCWLRVVVLQKIQACLIPQEGIPVKVIEELKPIRKFITPKGETVLDFGRNLTGRVRYMLYGNSGDTIVMHFAETLDKDGNFYTRNLRTAKATDCYIFGKTGWIEHFSRFTFYGFRYAKIEKYRGRINLEDFTAQVISSNLRSTGKFECSDTLVNRLVENTRWSMTSNFLDIPTDCPQRDERLGWTADAQVFIPTACYFADVKQFFVKWMRDLVLEQAPDGGVPCVVPDLRWSYGSSGWDDAVTVIPSTLYKVYGDTAVLREFYPAMKKWVGYIRRKAGKEMIYDGGRFGDWFAYVSKQGDYPGATTDKDFVGTAYFARSVQLTAQAAKVLGIENERLYYENLHDSICQVFNREYVTPSGRLVSNTQTAYTLALAFELLPDSIRKQAAQRLANDVNKHGHITTGFLGTPLICQVLTRFGYVEEAYKLLFNKNYPSWLYPVIKGATTVWERWDAILPDGTVGNYSLNHYAFGSVVDWLFKYVAGINQSETSIGFNHIVIAPHPSQNLKWAKAEFCSVQGTISSHWWITDSIFNLDVVLPDNCSATIFLPTNNSCSCIKVQGGRHSFSCPI